MDQWVVEAGSGKLSEARKGEGTSAGEAKMSFRRAE
jgi:hypothetical protein